MEIIKKLNYLLDGKTKIRLVGIFILTILGSFAELIGVAVVLPVVNLAMDTSDYRQNYWAKIVMSITGADTKEAVLIWIIIATVIVYVLKNIYLSVMNYRLYRFAADVKRAQATKLMKAYMAQPYEFFLYHNTSDLLRGVNNDTAQLYEVIINCLMVVSSALTALEIIVYLSVTNFWMTMIIALLLGLCAAITILGLQRRFRRNGRENQKLSSYLIKYLQQAFEGIKEIKLLNNEEYFIEQYSKSYKKQADISVSNSFLNLIPKYLVELVCICGILGYLAINIITNPNYIELMPQLAVFCVAAYKLLPSVNSISGYMGTIIFHRASIDLVYNDVKSSLEIMNSTNMNAGTEELVFEKNIELKDVSFRYENTERYIISDADIVIGKGESVAFIGASGGGKTTTADIILSLLSPTKGSVLIDGKDVKCNILNWRSKIGYIPQFIYLSDDTIRNNVAFGVDSNKIDDAEVWRALEEAQLKSFVEELPNGLDTKVGERGARISGGQRQRIGIARALYRNPDVLVFDEATSALDTNTEREVMGAIEGLQGTKTIIMIAHRLSTIENCDSVYRIENGLIVKER